MLSRGVACTLALALAAMSSSAGAQTSSPVAQGTFTALSKLDGVLGRALERTRAGHRGAPDSSVLGQARKLALDAMAPFPALGGARLSTLVADAARTDQCLQAALAYASDVVTRTGSLTSALARARLLDAQVGMIANVPAHGTPAESASFQLLSLLVAARRDAAGRSFSSTRLRAEIRKISRQRQTLFHDLPSVAGAPFGSVATPFESILLDLAAGRPEPARHELIQRLENARKITGALEKTLQTLNQAQTPPPNGGGPPPPPAITCAADGEVQASCTWSTTSSADVTSLQIVDTGGTPVQSLYFVPSGSVVDSVTSTTGANCVVQRDGLYCDNLDLQNGSSLSVQLTTQRSLGAGATGTLTMYVGSSPGQAQPGVILTLGGQ